MPGAPDVRLPGRPVSATCRSAGSSESRHPGRAAGTVVAMTYGHRSGYRADPLDRPVRAAAATTSTRCWASTSHTWDRSAPTACCTPPPTSTAPTYAVSADGVRGRRVAVIGAGVVGLLTALFARRHGAASVVVVDPTPQRREVAGRPRPGGRSTLTAVDPAVGAQDPLAHGAGDRGADVVFQCRGQPRRCTSRCGCCAPRARSSTWPSTRAGADAVRLGEEFHHNGLARALRPDRPGAARAGPHLGPRPALAPRPSTCCATKGPRYAGTWSPPSSRSRPTAAADRPRRRPPARAPGGADLPGGRLLTGVSRARGASAAAGGARARRCRVPLRAMGVSQRFKSRFRKFLQRPGTTVDLAPLEKRLPAIEAREEALSELDDDALTEAAGEADGLRRDLRGRPRGRPPRARASGRTTCSCSARWRCSPARSPRWPPVRARR